MDNPSRRLMTTEARERNRLFNEELRERGLSLAVTRTWGNRALPTNSPAWKALRLQVLKRDNWCCRFCGLRSEKWMICDHIDGDASNNALENLGINCPICDLIRHCGLAGSRGLLSLWHSELSQIAIVRMTQAHFEAVGILPSPSEIDPNARFFASTTVEFANLLLRMNYSELPKDIQNFKGFFEPASATTFAKFWKPSHATE